jgi:hypothetical protein
MIKGDINSIIIAPKIANLKKIVGKNFKFIIFFIPSVVALKLVILLMPEIGKINIRSKAATRFFMYYII